MISSRLLLPLRAIRAATAHRGGAAIVEMAITLPIMLLLLCGIVTYGSWIALAHAVQQSANEGARASLSGLSQAERASLATSSAQATMARTYHVAANDVLVTVSDDGATLSVDVAYDASRNPLLSLPLIPLPAKVIERRTAVRLAGL